MAEVWASRPRDTRSVKLDPELHHPATPPEPVYTSDKTLIFTSEALEALFPRDRNEAFFDALYGDPEEAAFSIRLAFSGADAHRLHFQFHLEERPGKCLACNLTYGLPAVFARHSVINLRGLIEEVGRLLDIPADRLHGQLGRTETASSSLHRIPLTISIQSA